MSDTIEKLLELRAWFAERPHYQQVGGAGTYRKWTACSGRAGFGDSCLLLVHRDKNNHEATYDIIRIKLTEAIGRLFPDRTGRIGFGRPCIPDFNNHAQTTHADLMMVIDAALAAAEYDIPIPDDRDRARTAAARRAADGIPDDLIGATP